MLQPDHRVERYNRITPNELDAAGRSLRAAILDGPRKGIGGARAIEAEDGTLNGPFGVFLFAPAVGYSLQELGAALRTETSLTSRERELAIIAVASELRCQYELSAHLTVARALGVTESDIDAVLTGTDPADVALSALIRFVRANAQDATPRQAFEAITAHFDRRAVVEILALVAYYRGLASMLNLLNIEVPAPPATN